VIERSLEDHIEAAFERRFRRLAIVRGRGMEHHGAADGAGVGDDEPREAELTLEQAVVEPVAGPAGRAVERVVGGHHRARPAPLDAGREGRQVDFAEQALVPVDRIAVAPSVARVGDQVLGRRDDPAALELRDEGDPHLPRQAGILAVGLLHPPPAAIGGDVDHGREHHADPGGAALIRDGGGDLAHQGGVEGRREADRLRERRGTFLDQAVKGLGERNDRDAQARLFHEMALGLVDVGCGLLPAGSGTHLEAERALGVSLRAALEASGQHEELPELLPGRHA
jgi:hypothetical protein